MLAVVTDNVGRSAGGMENLNAIVAGGFVAIFISVALIIPMAVRACCSADASKDELTYSLKCYGSLGGIMGAVWIGMGVLIVVYNKYADNFFGISKAKI